jgi:hypothetical protein
MTEQCSYQSCWHNHPELPRHGEAASDPKPEPEPLPEPELEAEP